MIAEQMLSRNVNPICEYFSGLLCEIVLEGKRAQLWLLPGTVLRAKRQRPKSVHIRSFSHVSLMLWNFLYCKATFNFPGFGLRTWGYLYSELALWVQRWRDVKSTPNPPHHQSPISAIPGRGRWQPGLKPTHIWDSNKDRLNVCVYQCKYVCTCVCVCTRTQPHGQAGASTNACMCLCIHVHVFLFVSECVKHQFTFREELWDRHTQQKQTRKHTFPCHEPTHSCQRDVEICKWGGAFVRQHRSTVEHRAGVHHVRGHTQGAEPDSEDEQSSTHRRTWLKTPKVCHRLCFHWHPCLSLFKGNASRSKVQIII